MSSKKQTRTEKEGFFFYIDKTTFWLFFSEQKKKENKNKQTFYITICTYDKTFSITENDDDKQIDKWRTINYYDVQTIKHLVIFSYFLLFSTGKKNDN